MPGITIPASPYPDRARGVYRARDEWCSLTSSPRVLDVVFGLHLPFLGQPPSRPPNRSAHGKASRAVQLEIKRLLQLDAIEHVDDDTGFYSPIFTVTKKDGSQRLVIDLRSLNRHIEAPRFKMEGVPMLMEMIRPNDFMARLDLKDAFLSVSVAPRHRQYLRFQCLGQRYQFKAMPCGLNVAPWIFTKLLRPVVKHWRHNGVHVVIYQDDMIFLSPSRRRLCQVVQSAIELLQDLGFRIHPTKSMLVPSQSIEFLGFVWDTSTMTIAVPEAKRLNIVFYARLLLHAPRLTARHLLQVISMMRAVNLACHIGKLHYRGLQRCLHDTLQWGSLETTCSLSPEGKDDLRWWIRRLKSPTFDPIHPSDDSDY